MSLFLGCMWVPPPPNKRLSLVFASVLFKNRSSFVVEGQTAVDECMEFCCETLRHAGGGGERAWHPHVLGDGLL